MNETNMRYPIITADICDITVILDSAFINIIMCGVPVRGCLSIQGGHGVHRSEAERHLCISMPCKTKAREVQIKKWSVDRQLASSTRI
jgi:hypothetical protein